MSTNYPVYQNDLGIPQWIILGAQIDTHASGSVYDWLQARTRNIFKNATGDTSTVLGAVASYVIAPGAGGGNTPVAHTPQSQITIEPYSNSYRLDSATYTDCGTNSSHDLTNAFLHESRHAYQFAQATLSNNDTDGDYLVKSMAVAPLTIVIDSINSRTVCNESTAATEQRSYHGDSVADTYEAPDEVLFALQYDALMFAASHDH